MKEVVDLFKFTHMSEEWVLMKPLCDTLGLLWKVHKQEIRANPLFKPKLIKHRFGNLPNAWLCLPYQQVGLWLATLNANAVSTKFFHKLLDFQTSLYKPLLKEMFHDKD